MIIKSGAISAGDGPRITDYVVAEADNERVEIVQNDNDQLLIADHFAELKSRKNGLLHIVIAPSQELAANELKATIEAIHKEFGFNPADPETLAMHQSRRADGSVKQHWHLVRPAADSESGKTYRLFRSKAKDEAVSRLLELQLGHKLTSGSRNDFAELRLREQGHDELAERLAEAFSDQDTPKAAYSQNEHQQAKRQSYDLPGLRQQLKELAELPRPDQPLALAELLLREGLGLQDAVTDGRGRSRINIELPGDQKMHNANRTLKIKAAEVAAFIGEIQEALHDRSSVNTAESRSEHSGSTIANHPRPEPDSPKQSGSDPAYECAVDDHASDQQELTEADTLAAAANDLRPQATKFARNRADDLTSSDIEAPIDPDDPNLLKKLSAILKRQLDRANAMFKNAMLPSRDPTAHLRPQFGLSPRRGPRE